MSEKIIHYCWFGPKPLSKLAKKCIKSWKKFLPDYEIKLWNEDNFDFNSCAFVKQAYEKKKWAFVSDYARMKVLKEYGGIYFDTDMEITKNIDSLLQNDFFFGVEDSGMIAAGVIYAKEKNHPFITEMVKLYESFEQFETEDLFKISIPRLFTATLKEKFGLDENFDKTQITILEKNNTKIYIYPREYFYPLSYDHQNNIYTDHTCMIHHYDATWTSRPEKIKLFFRRKNIKFMNRVVDAFVSVGIRAKRIAKKIKNVSKKEEEK